MARELFDRTPAYVYEVLIKILTHNDYKVLACLCHHQHWRTGKCWPGWKVIAQETGVGKNSIFKCLRRLKVLGCIGIEKKGRKNVYIVYRTLQATPETVTGRREQSPKALNRDAHGRIITGRREHIVTGRRERTVTGGTEPNESYERDILTRTKSNPTRGFDMPSSPLTISKKVRKEYEALWGKAKTDEYMRVRGYVVDPAEENASPKRETEIKE